MPARILLPLDDSETSQHTIDCVIKHRDLMPRDVHLLHVVDIQMMQRLVPDIQKKMVYDAAERAGHRTLDKLAGQFRDNNFDPRIHLALGTPGPDIIKSADELAIQLIIIGRHPGSGGMRDVILGSITNYVIRFSPCPVLLF